VGRVKKRIDPSLLAQLASAASADPPTPVEAVVWLRPEAAAQVVPGRERTGQIVRALLARVGKKVGLVPVDFHVFHNLGTFVIAAPGDYLLELLDQPEVAGALANRPGEPHSPPPSGPATPARKPSRR
jgi:hypothetical protein